MIIDFREAMTESHPTPNPTPIVRWHDTEYEVIYMRDISMERVNQTREAMLETVKSPTLTHEQKVATMANQADSLLEVLNLPEGLDELLNQTIDRQCICDLSEGHAPLRPRYIIPNYEKFMKEGSRFLNLEPPKDLFEAINALEIIYRHVPSVTNFPVYVGQLDELLDPFVQDMDEELAQKLITLFFGPHDPRFLLPRQHRPTRHEGRPSHPEGDRSDPGCRTEHHDEVRRSGDPG